MASPLLGVAWERCVLPFARDATLEAEARRVIGVVPTWTGYFTSNPWVVRAMLAFYGAVQRLQHVDPLLAGQVSLAVGQDNSCRYCYAVVRLMLRLRGYSEARVQELEGQLAGAHPDARTAAALRFARRMSRSTPMVGPADIDALRAAGFGPEAIRELALTAAYDVFANRIVTIPAVPPDEMEQMPQRWFFALVRPLMHRMLERHVARLPPPAPAVADTTTGPFAGLLPSLGPFAGTFERILAGLWESRALPRRTKLLMMAVIGRALDCGATVTECTAALAVEGLDSATVAHILTHLRGDPLDAREQTLLDFARETVWYQPAAIQRKAQALAAGLPPEVVAEAVGIAALSNTLCRLRPALASQ